LSHPAAISERGSAVFIPAQVRDLAPREQEIALIIYYEGSMTGKSVQARLSRALEYSSLRSVLGRLCRKGILNRKKLTGTTNPRSKKVPYVYFPAITVDAMRQMVLKQVARDYFDGSLVSVMQMALDIVDGDVAPSPRRASKPRAPSALYIAA